MDKQYQNSNNDTEKCDISHENNEYQVVSKDLDLETSKSRWELNKDNKVRGQAIIL